MKNWLSRIFRSDGAQAPSVTPPRSGPGTPPAAPTPGSGPADPAEHARQTDLAFWHWLSSPIAGDLAPAARQRLLDELDRLSQAPGAAADLVPRVPEVIPQLLGSLRDEAVSGPALARQVARDAVLVAEVIREANSAFYRPAAQVRALDAAVMVLGQNGLRMLLARVAFRPIIGQQSGACTRQVAPRIWHHSERCARAAGLLGPGLGADPFETYLAGLMHDVGLVVAFRLLDRLSDTPRVPQDPDFVAAVVAGARELSARIALHWELPPPVVAAIIRAGQPGSRPMAEALGQADRLAKLRLLMDAGALPADAPLLASFDEAQARAFKLLGPDLH